MPRSADATKQRILSAAYKLFYQEGFARVSMDAIAEAAGVTKRTLYNHFVSKDELAAAVLDHQHIHALKHIQNWTDKSAANSAAYLASLFDQLEVWASEPRWLGSGYTRLTMELADLPGHPARRAAHRHKSAVENWLTSELTKYGQPCPQDVARQIMLLIEGCLSLVLNHGDTDYVAAAAKAANTLVKSENT